MELTASSRYLKSSPGLQPTARPGTPALEPQDAASFVTTAASSAAMQQDHKGAMVRAEMPATLARALSQVVVIDSPGTTPSPVFDLPATPVPVCQEEADDTEPGAPAPSPLSGRSRSNSGEQPGRALVSSVVWHPARPVSQGEGSAQPAAQPAVEVVVAEPVAGQPQPLPQPLPAGVVAGQLVPRQGLGEKLAIGLRVGAANGARELVAGGLRAATQVTVARSFTSTMVGRSSNAAHSVSFAGLVGATVVAPLLAGHTIGRLAGGHERQIAWGVALAWALAGGTVPILVADATAQAGWRVAGHFVGRLAGALATETFMQLLDGVTPRARLVAPPADPLEPAQQPKLGTTLWGRHGVSALAYAGLGTALELAVGPQPAAARALENLGLSTDIATAASLTIAELYFALWDGLATAASAANDNLELALEPGRLSALTRNLTHLRHTLARIGESTGARVLASAPLDYLNIGWAMHPGSQAIDTARRAVLHLSRLRGYLLQEGRTPAGTSDGAAADFLAAHDAFLGSAGSGIDIRRRPGAGGEPDPGPDDWV